MSLKAKIDDILSDLQSALETGEYNPEMEWEEVVEDAMCEAWDRLEALGGGS